MNILDLMQIFFYIIALFIICILFLVLYLAYTIVVVPFYVVLLIVNKIFSYVTES